MIIYRGSTKEISKRGENLVFHFTDDYSVFDYGKMPNQIPKKGKYLAEMADQWFQILHSPKTFDNLKTPPFIQSDLNSELLKDMAINGARTHFISRLGKRKIEVEKFKVVNVQSGEKEYDYSKFKERPTQTTMPLECIFRFGAPLGSSLLDKNPEMLPNTLFDEIKIEFTTKAVFII